MPELHTEHTRRPAPDSQPELRAAYAVAAQAVLAGKFNRPTLRVTHARLRPEISVTFALRADQQAMRHNRPFLEETVMVTLAGAAAEELKFATRPDDARLAEARAVLRDAASGEDELAVVDAYLSVLLARTRAHLRQCWSEVEVVGLGLLEHGVLDEAELLHRVRCVQGIRSATLN